MSRPVTLEALPAEQVELALVIDTSGQHAGRSPGCSQGSGAGFRPEAAHPVPVSVIGFGA